MNLWRRLLRNTTRTIFDRNPTVVLVPSATAYGRRCNSSAGILYRHMVPDDEAQVRTLLYENYYPRNPISRFLGIKTPDECKSMVDRTFPLSAVEGLSVVVEDVESKSPVGVTIGRISDSRGERTLTEPPLSDSATEKEKIFTDFTSTFFQNLYQGQAEQWFQEHNLSTILMMEKVTVHRDWGRNNIIKGMVQQAARLALGRDVYCVAAESSNPILERALEVLGFQVISRVRFSDYRYKGEKIFKYCDYESVALSAKIFNHVELK